MELRHSQRTSAAISFATLALVLAGCTGGGSPVPASASPAVPAPTPSWTAAPLVSPSPSPAIPSTSSQPTPTPAPTGNPTPAPTPRASPKPTVVTIAVPVYRQAMPLDCETSALRMALAYYGHRYTDAQLFADEPVDLRAPVMGSDGAILQWGNPYTHFVGDVHGAQSTPTGYGVYYPVIVALARSHGLPNAVGGEGYSAATVYRELRAGHPVEVWVTYSWRTYPSGVWTAWDGARIRYAYGEHAVTLTGVSATSVRVNDPSHGTRYWITRATFERSWAFFNNMAVVFR